MSAAKMSSQESSSSQGSRISLPLSQDTVDYMVRSVGDIADPSVCDFTNVCPRDLSIRKEDSQQRMQDRGEDKECYDLTTTSRSGKRPQATSPSAPGSVSLPSLPSTTECNGDHTFKVTLSEQSKETKAADWIYSEKLHKVFVRFDASCPFLFSSSPTTPVGCVMRAMPVFVRPQHMHEVVRRCPHHAAMSAPSGGDGVPPSDHLIRSENKLARYHTDSANGFHSVTVPYDVPPADMEWTSHLYQFTCFSSCVGGLNRRPFQVLFTLEDNVGRVLGRHAIEVRICACPGRDRQIEEKNAATSSHANKPLLSLSAKTSGTAASTDAGPAAKRRRPNDEADDVFVLSVRGNENYALLRQLRDSLEVSSAIPRPQFEQIRSQQESLKRRHPNHASLQVTSSSTPVRGVTGSLPDAVSQRPLATVEQAHSTRDVYVSADTSCVASTAKYKYSCEADIPEKVETWLLRNRLSSCVEPFHKLQLVNMSQLESFTLHDFEQVGLTEDYLARVWLAFSRLRQQGTGDRATPNGDVFARPTNSFTSHP